MAKIVTKKSQIPKSAKKKIKNFSKLTDNQAILQYELNNLKRRLSKQEDYTKFIKIPKSITKSFIQEIHSIRGKQVEKFKERVATGKPLTSYEERKAKQYERDKRDISKELDLVKEFFDDLRTEIDNYANQSIIVNSSYKNGRTKNTRLRQWITDNITRAKDKLITLIDSIEADEDRSISVYERFANDSSALSDLQDAISEYLAGSYSSPITSTGTDMNYQRVYAMLSGSPMSLEDAEEFEV